jgi:hypothetical protein
MNHHAALRSIGGLGQYFDRRLVVAGARRQRGWRRRFVERPAIRPV